MLRDTPRLFVSRVLLGMAIFIPFSLLAMLFTDDSLQEAVEHGIARGLGAGIGLFSIALLARRYRARVDPAGRRLSRPEPAQTDEPPPWDALSRRHYNPVFFWMVGIIALLMTLGLAIAATFMQDDLAPTVFFWGTVLLVVYYLWSLCVTFVHLRPEGIVIRKPHKRFLVAWDDLAEVRWEREPGADFLLFCANDDTKVKSPFAVAEFGMGGEANAASAPRCRRGLEMASPANLRSAFVTDCQGFR